VERTVERLLGVRVVDRVDLGSSELAPVARLILDRSYDGIGRTVIAKGRRLADAGWGSSADFLRNERLALDHLRGTGLAPTFLASTEHDEVVVLSDLGTGPTVQQLLFGDDPEAATQGLVAMARLAKPAWSTWKAPAAATPAWTQPAYVSRSRSTATGQSSPITC
jgi:hypothetical protein